MLTYFTLHEVLLTVKKGWPLGQEFLYWSIVCSYWPGISQCMLFICLKVTRVTKTRKLFRSYIILKKFITMLTSFKPIKMHNSYSSYIRFTCTVETRYLAETWKTCSRFFFKDLHRIKTWTAWNLRDEYLYIRSGSLLAQRNVTERCVTCHYVLRCRFRSGRRLVSNRHAGLRLQLMIDSWGVGDRPKSRGHIGGCCFGAWLGCQFTVQCAHVVQNRCAHNDFFLREPVREKLIFRQRRFIAEYLSQYLQQKIIVVNIRVK